MMWPKGSGLINIVVLMASSISKEYPFSISYSLKIAPRVCPVCLYRPLANLKWVHEKRWEGKHGWLRWWCTASISSNLFPLCPGHSTRWLFQPSLHVGVAKCWSLGQWKVSGNEASQFQAWSVNLTPPSSPHMVLQALFIFSWLDAHE